MQSKKNGQVLVEILVASLILVLVSLSVASISSISLRAVPQTRAAGAGAFLAKEELEALRAIAREDWHNISGLATSTAYFTTTSAGKWIVYGSAGTATTPLNNITYIHSFSLSPIYRSTSTGDIVTSGGYYDPSTLKATITVSWTDLEGTSDSSSQTIYLSRFLNNVYTQTDWSTGPVGEQVVTSATTTFATSSSVDYTSSTGAIILQTN